MARIAGILSLSLDGVQYTAAGAFTVQPLTRQREGLAGDGGIRGYREMPIVPYFEGDISTDAEVSAETLGGITDATAQLELANGKSYVFRNAWQAGDLTINSNEGTMAVRFEAMDCDEV